jgi:hypothetical protein
MSLIDAVRQQLGPNEIQQISQRLGVEPAVAQKAVQAAVPMIVGGVAGAAQQPGGERVVQSAVDAHAGANSMLGRLGGLLDDGGSSGMLGSILGQHQATVQQGVQQASGLDAGKAQQLMSMLGPIVMSVLAQHQAQGQQGSGGKGLGGLLQEAAQAAAAQSGGSSALGGVLGKVLGGAA